MNMRIQFYFLLFGFFLLASSCHKCYECKQYCAYCKSVADSGVVYKFCSANDVPHANVDSIKNAYQANGFNCSLLKDDKKVCDRPAKINDAVNYYMLEDYYCYSM